jgi:hypothetical protein
MVPFSKVIGTLAKAARYVKELIPINMQNFKRYNVLGGSQ